MCKFPSSLKTNLLKRASLFTTFYDCGVVEGSFARTKKSISDFSFLLDTIGGWLKICASLGCS